MRAFLAVIMVCSLGACASQGGTASQTSTQLPPAVMPAPALQYAFAAAPSSAGAAQAMPPSSDCAENVNNVVSHLEWLMAQNAATQTQASAAAY